jgi:radical S-adenosyl methionine domain-containing protein 2
LVPEPNRLMEKSYLIMDEYLRCLDRTGKQPSRPIWEVGVQRALDSVFWDEKAFLEEGGLYDWVKRGEEKAGCAKRGVELDW